MTEDLDLRLISGDLERKTNNSRILGESRKGWRIIAREVGRKTLSRSDATGVAGYFKAHALIDKTRRM